MHGNDSKKSGLWAPGIAALWAVLAASAGGGASAAPVETVLYSFTGGPSDGNYPTAGLFADTKGNLYGTTTYGGGSGCSASGPGGCGTVFELTPAGGGWTETVLYHFCTLANCSDGSLPFAGLIADSKGNLYGTTANGGGPGCSASGPGGCGTVFELMPASDGGWTETVLHSFADDPSDGAIPLAGLIADGKGNLYGTTNSGGANGYGTVFELTPAGVETVLYNFCFVPNCNNGVYPQAGLIADKKGNLYGTTLEGGSSGYGTVFELSPPAITGGDWSITVPHAFAEGSEGSYPLAGLIADNEGNLYGTTSFGGGTSSAGTVFELSPPAIAGGAWSISMPHTFTGGSDGSHPYAGLIADMNGNLYGTTGSGGRTSNAGTVFELIPAIGGGWTKNVLYNFCSLTPCGDGANPTADLIADSKGNLYGTTNIGGASNAGTVFELTFGTGFVPPVPFAAFSTQLVIQFGGTAPNDDYFELHSDFTLGSASNGINPPAEKVTLQVGTFTTTIPSFSFTGAGSFSFVGKINGVDLKVSITPTGTKRYALLATAPNASLTGIVNPVPVTLTIGADTGTVSVTAFVKR